MIQNDWTTEEIEILRKDYPNGGSKAVIGRINHPLTSIHCKASALGIKVAKEQLGYHARNTEDLSHLLNLSNLCFIYLLGFLWADGTVGKSTYVIRLKISAVDFHEIEPFIMPLCKTWRYREWWDKNPNHAVQSILEINHKEFWDFLVQHEYIFKSGGSARSILAAIPKELRHYWWRGYIDGDGGYTDSGNNKRLTIASCHDQNWDFLDDLCAQLDIGYRLAVRSEGKSRNSYVIFENETYFRKITDYIYQGAVFGLSRKFNAYTNYILYKIHARLNKTSIYRGVCLMKNGKWASQIYKGRPYRAYFDVEEDAAKHYDAKAIELFGDKAVLNFPQ